MEERRAGPRYPNLIWALSEKHDSSRKAKLFEPHRHKIEGRIDTSRIQIEQGEIESVSTMRAAVTQHRAVADS